MPVCYLHLFKSGGGDGWMNQVSRQFSNMGLMVNYETNVIKNLSMIYVEVKKFQQMTCFCRGMTRVLTKRWKQRREV